MKFEELRTLIVDTLGCDEALVTQTASLTDLKADSLSLVELVMSLEESTGLSIADEEMAKLKTVGDVLAYVQANAKGCQ